MVHVVGAELPSKPVLWNLFQLYAYEFSEFTDQDIDDDGAYAYKYFDRYWTDADRTPYLFRQDDRLAGFALVRSGEPHDMAEFFIMKKYRRRGLGADAAHQVFARHPGAWQVRQMTANTRATAFWYRAIPVPFEEVVDDHGPRQLFQIESAGIDGP
ncbi:MAG: GNAT family N-acetyltransferase [Acidimicrobiia bacterium]